MKEKPCFNSLRLPFLFLLLHVILAALGIFGAVFYVVYIRDGGRQSSRALVIRDSASGRTYGRWSLEEGGEFAIEFIHSVNQSPVKETFVIEERMIRLQELRFFSFGAGMPSDLGEGQELSRDGDAMIITGFNTSFRELNYIVGTVSDHLFFINGEIYSLRDLCGVNANISISLR